MTRVPVATYRLQLGPALTFDDAAALVPYLDALGISDCYTSPFFETSSTRSHGYDVADHNRIRDELGGEPAFLRFAEALRRQGQGLLVDIVPNHMGIAHAHNAWWRDVLQNGESSRFASVFDIDWHPVKRELAGKVLLPILGDQYGTVLESGQLVLELTAAGALSIRYYETALPVAARSYGRLLRHRIEELQRQLGVDDADLLELKSVTTWFVTIPPRENPEAGRLAPGRPDIETGERRLAELLARSPAVAAFVAENLRIFNGSPGDSQSFDLLDALIMDQSYRLAYWRVAGHEINYRRFFDINDLAAIRMEDPDVFAETHRLVVRLVREGVVTGLRIDHPDGLYAPSEYFRRLQEACGGQTYIVAEKILAVGERLPDTWAVAGTTGYEFTNLLNGLFVDRLQARAMEDIYARLMGARPVFGETVYESKRLVMETSMASEIGMLAYRLNRISERHRSSRDFTLQSLTQALVEIVACFPVYRTYLGESGEAASERDREFIARAIAAAQRRTPALATATYDWLQDLLTLRMPPWATDDDRRARTDWVMRFQQITGPVTAKGYEDTALYRYTRLVSLNEVGGDPGRFGTSRAEFHAAMAARAARCPHGLSATATHDTKRGEDVRARINVLSEIPREWRRRVSRWQRLNRRHRTVVDGVPVPQPNEESLMYQTLVGAWPIDAERFTAYVLKAAHEAKVRTSWVNPSSRYDGALAGFADAILDPRRSREFLRDFRAFQAEIAHFGAFNSLAQTVIKITAPGVPDFYQGTELWDGALVDPDNRRPVDFALRRRLLDELTADLEGAADLAAVARDLIKSKDDGRVKMYVTRQALHVRRVHAALFRDGAYHALEVEGRYGEHLCAFARTAGRARETRHADPVITIVPRLLARRGGDDLPVGPEFWVDTSVTLPAEVGAEAGARFRNVFTDETVTAEDGEHGPRLAAGEVLASFPVALLERAA
jgi:(1->4)-alpha-D-glucan 1-alpha-D-glucosylmutase